jgi:hypothetical protein
MISIVHPASWVIKEAVQTHRTSVRPYRARGPQFHSQCGSEIYHTGLFFDDLTVESPIEAIPRFKSREGKSDPNATRSHASQFGTSIFEAKIKSFTDGLMDLRREATGIRGQ